MNYPPIVRTIRHASALAAGLAALASPNAFAQQAAAPDAATLAKYDTNRDGRLDAAEQAAMAAAQPTVPVTTTTTGASGDNSDTVRLSPFEVVSDNKGYYASNTMSGTRFNTKLEDLAAAVSVVTKEQMEDFAMLDINDIFLYAAGTEGTGTFSDVEIDRNGQVFDNVQGNPTQANRVRGIAAANISLGNMETMGRVPVDPLAVDAVEVSRGPNANVFGLGNPSGTLNMVPSSANLTRDRSQVVLRGDSYDGYRGSLDLNRVILKNKLAVRVSGSYQHDGFVRKPSGVDTVRYNGMVRYQPFKYTTVNGSFSYYRQAGNRPNSVPPRDSVSYWVANGKPGWDPVAQVIHVNGQTLGPFTTDTGLPDYFTRAGAVSQRSNLYIDQTGLALWTTPNTNSTNPTTGNQSVRYMTSSSASGVSLGRFSNQPLFTTTPSVVSKSIYDWSKINLGAVNRSEDQTETYSFQVDQVILNTQRHTLVAQAGMMREDSERRQRTPLGDAGISGQTGQLFIDVNERLLDGSTNPFFGRPYFGVSEPRTRVNPTRWDTYRAQVAYKLDLTREKSWVKWLGAHQLTGYDEYKYRLSRNYSFRDVLTSEHSWIAAGTPRGNQGGITGGPAAGPNIIRGFQRYYVGDAVGQNIDYAPTNFKYGATTFNWGSYTIANGLPVAGSGNFRNEPATIGEVATTDGTGGGANTKQIIKTKGGVIQSHFLNSAVVTTFGTREDGSYTKFGSTPQLLNPDGVSFNYDSLNHWAVGDYRFRSGKTKTKGVVARPFRDLPFVTRAAEGSGAVRTAAQALRGLSLTYNTSDSFKPETPAQDLALRPLPNPTGTGKDYGFWLNLFDSRLVVRVNKWENTQKNARNGDANTIAQRVTRLDVLANDTYQLENQATAWITAVNPTWTQAQIRAEVAKQIGISPELQAILENPNPPLAATNDVVAKGTELEINFNPTRYWTVAANGTETQSTNANVSRVVQDWIDQRMPIWTTIRDQRDNALWWTKNYGGSQTASQNFASFVQAPYAVIKEQEGKPKPQIRRYAVRFSTSYQLAGLTEHKILKNVRVGGALRWEDKGSIGFYGKEQFPAVITALDPNKPIWDKGHTYVDLLMSYRTRLWANKIGANFQLNVRNIQENGRLQPIGVFPDGTPHTFRIVDPRQFILTATFDL